MNNFTPFKSFLPLAGKMFIYLEAIKNPKKHMVKTLAIGKTAILIEPNSDSPPPWVPIRISDNNLCILT
ncbi:hypothetical protein Hanom_Chr10g00892801 [Helianthus anomalus]